MSKVNTRLREGILGVKIVTCQRSNQGHERDITCQRSNQGHEGDIRLVGWGLGGVIKCQRSGEGVTRECLRII